VGRKAGWYGLLRVCGGAVYRQCMVVMVVDWFGELGDGICVVWSVWHAELLAATPTYDRQLQQIAGFNTEACIVDLVR